MKKMIFNKVKIFSIFFLLVLSTIGLSSCKLEKLFVFGGTTGGTSEKHPDIETFEGTGNALFFALYNYYGYEGQHFTNKWLGMRDALEEHGITVTGWEGEKDARKFKITREADCDLPEDTVIYMVNNQNWDAGIQFNKPFARYHPMVVISTCNGVEFASSPILSSGDKISNATMGGFSPTYREAFVNGSLHYVVAKYSAHVAPIFAAAVNAVETGEVMRNADGTALHLSISTWAIQTLSQYDEMEAVDSIKPEHPTVRKINIDKFFDKNSPDYGPEKLAEWVANSSKEDIKALYELNGTNAAEDTASFRKGEPIKCGIIGPSSVNDQVGKYIEYISNYLATAYNVTILPYGAVTSINTQSMIAKQLCNQGADFIISLQDDTDRNEAAKICNTNKVYFAIGGSCQNEVDYEGIKDLPYYIGSVGTSTAEERRSAREMTEYYIQCLLHRASGDLDEFQIAYKGIVIEDEEETPVAYRPKKEDELWLS